MENSNINMHSHVQFLSKEGATVISYIWSIQSDLFPNKKICKNREKNYLISKIPNTFN